MRSKLSTLFFSTARKVARLQRTAWSLGMPGLFDDAATRRARKRPAKAAKPAKAPAARSAVITDDAPEFDPQAYAGTWKTRVYRTPPVPGAWPVRLSYSVYIPPRLRKDCPMLVMLHGCEQSATDFALGTRMHRLADREGVLLVYPQQSRRAQRHRCWHWYQPDAAHGYAEADAIAGIAQAAIEDYRVDPTRVYIAGLSAGAGMAALVALRHPGVFAALGMHSGPVLGSARSAGEGLRAMRHGAALPPAQAMATLLPDRAAFPGMPAIILQGDRDAVVDKRNGRQLLAQLAWANGVDLDDNAGPETEASGTDRHHLRIDVPAGRGSVVTLCEVPGLGHAWSGGDGRVRFHARHGPDAARLMWQFFKSRRRLPAASTLDA
ncbi:Esterase [Bordetella sputigena]|uniref:extracellular catalytic domain type 1 short-chain-length polyhydroxyalkanoate depolymerase n=1 Tax=Bordetella sputigena TaxID=1416810 RepID=UPI0039F0BF66